jgi:hypothetical protein
MKVTLGENEYSIWFEYFNTGEGKKFRRWTRCVIARGLDTVATGLAAQNPIDRYTKEEGRKWSLGRAVMEFSRDDRRAIWEAYRNRTQRKETA